MSIAEVDREVKSTTHRHFAIDCSPHFRIIETDGVHRLIADIHADTEVLLDTWRTVDSYLAAMSIVADGVFTREVWTEHHSRLGLTIRDPKPRELMGLGGLSFGPIQELQPSMGATIATAASAMANRVRQDDDAFAVLTFYTVSNWFLTSKLIREAGINYFTVVEAVASIERPRRREQATYELKDIYSALERYGLDDTEKATIRQGLIARNQLAHGHPNQLILAQHSLQTYPESNSSLYHPALLCKQAADTVLRHFFRAGGP